MLQKCYNCNNSVTNVNSGARFAIVESGHQIGHPSGTDLAQGQGTTTGTLCVYTCAQRAGSWKASWGCELDMTSGELGFYLVK